jgi:tape measure domain-containing protein
MADWTARLAIEVLTKGIDEANRQLAKLNAVAAQVEQQTQRTATATERMAAAYSRLQVVLAALGVGSLIRQFVSMSDTMKRLEGQLRLVTTTSAELRTVQRDLFELAQETRSSLEATISLYSRMARSTEGLGITHQRLLGITRTVNQAIQVSGITAAEAGAGVIQFGQALASGTLRGDELRSVLENMPRLAKALKDGLAQQGLAGAAESASAALRRLAGEGKLTTDVLIRAVESQAEVLEREFAKMPRTVEQAATQMSNVLLASVAAIDGASGFTQAIMGLLDGLARIAADQGVIAFFTGLFTVLGWVVDVLRLLVETFFAFIGLIGDVGRWLWELVSGYDAVAEATRTYAQSVAEVNKAIDDGLILTKQDAEGKLAQLQATKVATLVTLAFAQAKLAEAEAQRAAIEAAASSPEDSFATTAASDSVSTATTRVKELLAVISDADAGIAKLQELIAGGGLYDPNRTAGGAGDKADEYEKITTALQRQIYTLDLLSIQEKETNDVAKRALEIEIRLREHLLKLKDEGRQVTEEERAYLELLVRDQIAAEERLANAQKARQAEEDALRDARRKSVERLEYEMRRQQEIGQEVADTMRGLFRSIVDGSFNAADALSMLADMLLRILELSVFGEQGFGGFFSSLISGALGAAGGGFTGGSGSPGVWDVWAKGGAFGAVGELNAFARGGIVNEPTFFRFAKGAGLANGLMGEAGPEAIMPLERMTDGRLGVAANGNSESAPLVISTDIHVTVEGGGSGNEKDDEAFAEKIGKKLRTEWDAIVDQRITRHLRPGGLLNRGAF